MKSFTELAFPAEHALTLPHLPTSYLKCAWIESQHCVSCNEGTSDIQNGASMPFAASPLILAQVESAKYLTEGEDVKTVIDLQINIKDLGANYLPGETVGILPKNPASEVNSLLECLGLVNKQSKFLETSICPKTTKKKAAVPNYIPKISTIKDILETCVEIRAVPKKVFLRALSECASDSREKRRLAELCSREGWADYNEHIVEARRTLLDILQCFSSCSPPFSLLLEHLPRLCPRPYSIASSPLKCSDKIRVVLSVVETADGKRGVCSDWLHQTCQPLLDLSAKFELLQISQNSPKVQIPLFLRKSSDFRVPEDVCIPLVMIGPGTGVAPFIGFLEHRQLQCENTKLNQDNWLFFGCRYKEKDFIFKKELNLFVEDKTLSKLSTSFSREPVQEKYVQDNIKKYNKEFVEKLLDSECHFYLCGDAKNMVKDIEEAIVQSIIDVKGEEKTVSESLYRDVVNLGRIHKDVWL